MELQQASSSSGAGLPRKTGQRSKVWDHFSQPVSKQVLCKHCQGKYKYTGGTTNLSNHLLTCQSYKEKRESEKGSEPSERSAAAATRTTVGTKPMESFAVSHSKRTCNSARSTQIRGLIADWVTADMRPLGIVNDPGFRQLLSFVEPSFTVPSRTTIASMVRRRHDAARKELVTKLAGATSIAITTDAWTSKAVVSFVTYTSHYVTDDWKLVSHVLETKRFNGSHTAENLAASTEAVLSRFNIAHDTVQCLVHDEAPNQMAASRLLRSQHHWDYQACAAHRLQTCIRHAITASRPVTKLLASSRQLVGHFSHSAKSTEALNKKQVAMASGSKSGNPLRVIQDVPTRWNSSFLMLQRLIHLRLPIMAVLEDPELTKSSHRHLQLKDHQWNLAKEIVAALEAPAKATTVLGGETYCTQTLVVPVAKSLLRGLRIANEELSASAADFRKSLAMEIEVKFSLDPFDPISLPSVSAALDPRSRSLGFLDSDEDKDELKSEIVRRVCAQITADSDGSSSDDECILEPPAKRPMEEDMSLFFTCPSVEPSTTSSAASDGEVEVTQFFTEKQVGSSVDPLDWWRTNADRFPTMARLAKRVLCIPATSVPSERVFSAAGIIVSKLRASLTHENVDALVFLHANSGLQAARTAAPVAVQQLMPRLERFAEEEADDLPPLPDL